MRLTAIFENRMSICLASLGFTSVTPRFFAFEVLRRRFLTWLLIGLLLILVALSFGSFCWAKAGPPIDDSIEVVTRSVDGEVVFVVKNVTNAKATKVQVWLGDANVQTDPAMLGSVFVKDSEIFFKPRFPLRAGATYNIQVSTNDAAEPDHFLIEIPKKKTAPTKIEQIYPSSDLLPENTLKFYVHFSAPMRKGDVYRYLQIREVGGDPVELPFLEIEQEFWSRDSKRLTLLLDPGRIKRGLKPREEMGPIFVQGSTYELVVNGDWPDGNGQPIGKDFTKRFRIAAEDHQSPDPANWQTKIPLENTTQPLVISFPQSLDHSMLQTAITILDTQSKPVAGPIEISKNESQWSLTPKAMWKAGSYTIQIDSRLEDNAGNSIEKQFDVDVFEKTQSPKTNSTKITFTVDHVNS